MIPNTWVAGKEINDRKVGGCMTGGRERERGWIDGQMTRYRER